MTVSPPKSRSSVIGIGLISLFLIVLAFFFLFLGSEGRLEVSFMDVGDGDSILIEAPSGQIILIDGGRDKSVIREIGRELWPWERQIDLVILTHPHKDHIAGLNYILESYDVERVIHTGVECDLPEYDHFLSAIEEEGVDRLNSSSVGDIILGEDCLLSILYPGRDIMGKMVSNLNNVSIVSRLDCAGRSYLFTGDIEEEAEKDILRMGLKIDSDILKVAHHGSNTSSIKEFIEEVSPSVSVISVDPDSPNNPDSEVIERLKTAGSKIEFTYNY